LLYLPYVVGARSKVLGFLASHLDNEGYAAGYGFHIIWLLRDLNIADLPVKAYLATSAAILAALGVMALLKRAPDEMQPAHMLAIATAFVWLSSPHYAWYFAWLVPLLVRQISPSVLIFTLLAVIMNGLGSATAPTQTFYYSVLFGGSAVLIMVGFLWHWRASRRP
jgi:alpha-1,6-mannosyltransferase